LNPGHREYKQEF